MKMKEMMKQQIEKKKENDKTPTIEKCNKLSLIHNNKQNFYRYHNIKSEYLIFIKFYYDLEKFNRLDP